MIQPFKIYHGLRSVSRDSVLAIAFLGLIACSDDAFGNNVKGIRDIAEVVGKQLAKYLDEHDRKLIAVRGFDMPVGLISTAGNRIRLDVVEALQSQGISVVDEFESKWVIHGRIVNLKDDAILRVVIRVFDADNVEVTSVQEMISNALQKGRIRPEIDDPNEYAALTGVNADFATSAVVESNICLEGTKRNGKHTLAGALETHGKKFVKEKALSIRRKIRDWRKISDAVVAKNVALFPSESSLFQVQVGVSHSSNGPYARTEIQLRDGMPFLVVSPGQRYAIGIVNGSDHDIAAAVRIDGVNVMRFSEEPAIRTTGMWHIPANSSKIVRGWYINREQIDEFLVSNEAKAAARVANARGMISVEFYYASKLKNRSDFDSLLNFVDRGLTTKRGQSLEISMNPVELYIGSNMLSAVSIRYRPPFPVAAQNAVAVEGNLPAVALNPTSVAPNMVGD